MSEDTKGLSLSSGLAMIAGLGGLIPCWLAARGRKADEDPKSWDDRRLASEFAAVARQGVHLSKETLEGFARLAEQLALLEENARRQQLLQTELDRRAWGDLNARLNKNKEAKQKEAAEAKPAFSPEKRLLAFFAESPNKSYQWRAVMRQLNPGGLNQDERAQYDAAALALIRARKISYQQSGGWYRFIAPAKEGDS